MSYTHSWDETAPADTADPGLLGQNIRDLKEDIRERMDTILATGGKWTDDPVVLDVGSIGVQTNVPIYFGIYAFQSENDEDDIAWFEDYFKTDTSSKKVRRDIPLPVGATVVSIASAIDINTAPDVNFRFRRTQYSTGGVSTVAAGTRSTSGVGEVSTGTINHQIEDDYRYFVEYYSTGGTGDFRIYGVKAVINVSGLDQYLG